MIEQAQQLMDAGQFAEAEAIYRSVLEQDAASTEAVFMLALARRAQGDLDEAVELMAKAASQDPDNVNIHYTLGTLHMSRKAIDDARRAYLRALQVDPFHIDAHNGVAFVELIAGNYSAAERAANLALTEDARNVQALVYLGTAKLEQQDSTKAIAYLQEALKEAPDHQSAQVQLGRAFMADGKAGFAMQCFSNVVEADPESATGWESLASSQLENGLAREASHSYQRALSLGRKSPAVLKGLADCEKALGNDEQAEQILQAASEASENASDAMLTAAELEVSRGNPAGALEVLGRLEGARSERAVLIQATALEQQRNDAAALSALKPLIDGDLPSENVQLAYARLLTKSGREVEADEIIDALLAAEKPSVAARLFRGYQLCRRGDEDGIGLLQEVAGAEGLSEVDQRRVSKMLATTLDGAGRFKEAAAYYAQLSGRLAQVFAVAQTAAHANRELLDAGELPATGAREDSVPLPPDPVFLYAWPGSGWEWLAAGLSAHPAVMLVADKPETQFKRRALISAMAGAGELSAASAGGAAEGAADYWKHLKSGGLEPGQRSTVDTMWISADMLPAIAALFPAAQVMVVGTDPREMLLDWFRSGYSDIQEMAETYRDQLDALDRYRAVLNIRFIDVDGNALKSEAVPELVKLTGALKLPWDDAIGTRIADIQRSVRPGRGAWSDYADALAEPLQVFPAESNPSDSNQT